jgi:hypothetical protein
MKLLVLFAIILACAGLALASENLAFVQSATDQVRQTGCEYNDAVLDTLAQKTKQDQVIIIIARLGTRESRKALNQRRLHNVMVYLTEFTAVTGGRRRPADIVLAKGSSNASYGVIELYTEGKLFDTLRPGQNADLLVGRCIPDDPAQEICKVKNENNFYPCLDKLRRSRL